jgi:hypothetical protein
VGRLLDARETVLREREASELERVARDLEQGRITEDMFRSKKEAIEAWAHR